MDLLRKNAEKNGFFYAIFVKVQNFDKDIICENSCNLWLKKIHNPGIVEAHRSASQHTERKNSFKNK
ncbi:hypothetical protein OA93_21060 [Flavobacterium sp. KMS]|nr:hypothetical protein OA93_21060 [Flavobacterium sp. KMS]